MLGTLRHCWTPLKYIGMPISKIRLKIFLAVWKRPEITELCFMGIQRLKKHPNYEISAFAVISEPEMAPLCNKYGIDWVSTSNHPVGRKKNYGLKQLANQEFDYLLEIGSDDLITNDLLTAYLPFFDQYEFFGISDAIYIESENGECRRHISHKTTYGAGRIISKRLLEEMNYNIWADELNRGLDNSSVANIYSKTKVRFHKIEPMDEPGVIDVKSNENLWKFNYFLGEPYDINKVFAKLSNQEVDQLLKLQNVSA